MKAVLEHYYEFGPFRLLPNRRQLLRQGTAIPLTAKVFDLLVMLVENNGALLERESLMSALWPHTIVEESNLTQSIFVLRKALGETREGERFIATVPGRGYRFVATVQEFQTEQGLTINVTHSQQKLITSLAVLPLKILSTSSSLGFLGMGIADAIIATLSSNTRLIVRPTTAILKYGSATHDPMVAGRELKVDAVLDGTIQQVGERIRVSVQLIRVNNNLTLWAGRLDETLTDIFALQDSIAEQVARALKLSVIALPRPQGTDNLDIWQLYLQGRYFQDKRTVEGLYKSISCAEEVIARAPQFAMAYACLADSYNLLGEYLYIAPNEAFPAAQNAVTQALALDPNLAEAHASQAEIYMFYDWDWVRAEREYRIAIELNPNYATAYHWYGWLLMTCGRFDEASHHLRMAQRIDPNSLYVKTALGLPHYYRGEYDLAILHHRQAIEMDGQFTAAHYYLGEALVQKGKYEEALQAFQYVLKAHSQQSVALYGHTMALAGRTAEAHLSLRELRELATQHYVSSYCFALLHVALDDFDAAFAALEQAITERAAWLIFLSIDPFLKRLQEDPRFASLQQKVIGRSVAA